MRFLSKKEPIPESHPSKMAKEPAPCDSDSRNRLKPKGQPETGGEQLELDFRLVMVEILGREATFRCQVCEIDDVKSLSQTF